MRNSMGKAALCSSMCETTTTAAASLIFLVIILMPNFIPANFHQHVFSTAYAQLMGGMDNYRNASGSSLSDNKNVFFDRRIPIKLGYLTAVKAAEKRDVQGLLISGAISYAVDRINNNTSLLPNHRLTLEWADTKADPYISVDMLTRLWQNGSLAFFGPEDTCNKEAFIASAWNLPLISYKCPEADDCDKDDINKDGQKTLHNPTFARTHPPASQVTKSVLSLLRHYNWTKFSIITKENRVWKSVADTLRKQARNFHYVINTFDTYPDPFYPDLNFTHRQLFKDIISRTRDKTRIYVFLGDTNAMAEMLAQMQKNGVLDSGQIVLIFVDLNEYSAKNPVKYFKASFDSNEELLHDDTTVEASRSLLVLAARPPRDDEEYGEFERIVNRYNEQPPFGFPGGSSLLGPKKLTEYASYLYDAVQIYAICLNETLERGGTPRNGASIVARMRGRSFDSIRGYRIRVDENGDAQGSFVLLSRQKHRSPFANYSMLPVAQFSVEDVRVDTDLPQYKLLDKKVTINWMNGRPPRDEPHCGFDGERCLHDNSVIIIASTVLGGLVLITAISAGLWYRRWQYEQQIAGLVWKIDIKDISTGQTSLLGGMSRTSLASLGSRRSGEDEGDGGGQNTAAALRSIRPINDGGDDENFCVSQQGQYRGHIVCIKTLVFMRKIAEISRENRKEMKVMKDLRHQNVVPFIGACVEGNKINLVWEYASKGALSDILENETIRLDSAFVASLVFDLVKGMMYIHSSELKMHGNLKSSNCVVTSRWLLQVTDYGLHNLRAQSEREIKGDDAFFFGHLWTAPEVLRSLNPGRSRTQKSDVYSFSIILHEFFTRKGPWALHDTDLTARDIISRVVQGESLRPSLKFVEAQSYIIRTMQDCWAEQPHLRPSFVEIRDRLRKMREGMVKSNIMDNMICLLEKYANNLEQLVQQRTEELEIEKIKVENLLHRMLPQTVARQLMAGKPVEPEQYSHVTIYFSDIVGFTSLSADSTPLEVVNFLNDLYTTFDRVIREFDVYKVETIGDAYMVVSGLPIRNGDAHATQIATMALRILDECSTFVIKHKPEMKLKIRIGLHSGPVVAGVVGKTMPRYCLFGDTVNTASRMESTGEALKIHCSHATKQLLEKENAFKLEARPAPISVKGKGEMTTYWLKGFKPAPAPVASAAAGLTANFSSLQSVPAPATTTGMFGNSDPTILLPRNASGATASALAAAAMTATAGISISGQQMTTPHRGAGSSDAQRAAKPPKRVQHQQTPPVVITNENRTAKTAQPSSPRQMHTNNTKHPHEDLSRLRKKSSSCTDLLALHHQQQKKENNDVPLETPNAAMLYYYDTGGAAFNAVTNSNHRMPRSTEKFEHRQMPNALGPSLPRVRIAHHDGLSSTAAARQSSLQNVSFTRPRPTLFSRLPEFFHFSANSNHLSPMESGTNKRRSIFGKRLSAADIMLAPEANPGSSQQHVPNDISHEKAALLCNSPTTTIISDEKRRSSHPEEDIELRRIKSSTKVPKIRHQTKLARNSQIINTSAGGSSALNVPDWHATDENIRLNPGSVNQPTTLTSPESPHEFQKLEPNHTTLTSDQAFRLFRTPRNDDNRTSMMELELLVPSVDSTTSSSAKTSSSNSRAVEELNSDGDELAGLLAANRQHHLGVLSKTLGFAGEP